MSEKNEKQFKTFNIRWFQVGDKMAGCQKGLNLKSELSNGYLSDYFIGIFHYRNEAFEEAWRFFQQAGKKRPDFLNAFHFLGMICTRRGEYRKAISYFSRILDMDSKHYRARFSRGAASVEIKAYQKAEIDYEQILTIAPDFSPARNNLAWLYATCIVPRYRDTHRALKLARQLIRRQPSSAVFHDTLAAAYASNDAFEAAVRAQRKAIALLAEQTEGQKAVFGKQMQHRLELYLRSKPYFEA